MKPELETLLKVIGTDQHVGTHGSIPEYLALVEAIEAGRDNHGLFKGVSFDRQDYRSAIVDFVPFLDQMSESAFSRLMFFAELLDFHLDREIGRTIKRSYIMLPDSPEQVGKRAKFLQTFSGIKPPLYTLAELQDEREVKERRPWQWIDAVIEIDQDAAREEIIYQLSSDSPDTLSFQQRAGWYVSSHVPNGIEYVNSILDTVRERMDSGTFEEMSQAIHDSISRRRLS